MSEEILWTSFLMMLSSEKTLAYWYRLKLPIERKRYSQAILFARGCLETIFYIDVVNEREIYDFQNSWKDYREANPVLSNNFLKNHKIASKNLINDEEARKIIQLVRKEIDFDEIDAVYVWALNYFRDSSDSILEAADRIRYLIDEEEKTNDKTDKLPEAFERIKNFCNLVKWRNSSLRQHFLVAREVYKMNLPSEFEMVLQDYFYEGARSCFSWAESVEYNLQYVNFVDRWKELKENIGGKNINLLLNRLEENLTTMPEKFWRFKGSDLEMLKKL